MISQSQSMTSPEPPDSSLPVSRVQVDAIISALDVSFVKLAECVVASGWRLSLSGTNAPAIHYCAHGNGVLLTDRWAPIELSPHTLVILPSNSHFSLEVDCPPVSRTVKGHLAQTAPDVVRRFHAGPAEPALILICGYFKALFGASIDLFDTLQAPIVETFSVEDRIDRKLGEALDELVSQETGTGAMSAGLLKLVLIALLRRSMTSRQVWAERFALLHDPQIARAFSEMAARPSAPHTVQSLAQIAGLSRSAFMSRFMKVFGKSPMATLRQIRMRHAANLLSAKIMSIDQVARAAGYEGRSSFSRAFRKVYGNDPTEHRHLQNLRLVDGVEGE